MSDRTVEEHQVLVVDRAVVVEISCKAVIRYAAAEVHSLHENRIVSAVYDIVVVEISFDHVERAVSEVFCVGRGAYPGDKAVQQGRAETVAVRLLEYRAGHSPVLVDRDSWMFYDCSVY